MNRDILWEAMGHTPDGDVNDDWIGNEAGEPMPEIWVYLAIIVQVRSSSALVFSVKHYTYMGAGLPV